MELTIDDRQFPDLLPGSGDGIGDGDWLVIRGHGGVDGREWRFTDPCLTIQEARALEKWLAAAGDGGLDESDPSHADSLDFIEPALRFERSEVDTDGATITIVFAHEGAPPWATEEVRFEDGHPVSFRLTHRHLRSLAAHWAAELSALWEGMSQPSPAETGYFLPPVEYGRSMLILVIVLIVLWVILAIVGFAIKGLLWLGIIGIVLVIATLVIGLVRRSTLAKRNRT
ncbi:hypothetical protein [Cryocola sp. 340MFSha3.1]|uniref:WapI family immunity protein n=1 Tax=Cryocola sp. 340MFSha3.1 TaxID=1169145 RepID=UPI0018C9F45A|nr:hypothetical protein [Cryocola sp. 340MFSha3.1]